MTRKYGFNKTEYDILYTVKLFGYKNSKSMHRLTRQARKRARRLAGKEIDLQLIEMREDLMEDLYDMLDISVDYNYQPTNYTDYDDNYIDDHEDNCIDDAQFYYDDNYGEDIYWFYVGY